MAVYGGALGYGTTALDGGALQVLPVGTSASPYGVNNAVVIGPGGGTLDLQSPLQIWTGSFTGPGAFTRLGPASLEIQRTLNHTGATSFVGGGTSTTSLRYQGA